ncbi:hypothetical protein N752_00460 [Desulforamulus aquiferis]|nr:phosphoribosyltransferase family protein [Desulforamulus aquiferis]RYD07087.1 hypothetical protein N752_00460 [Desulforamulus aquiferis]
MAPLLAELMIKVIRSNGHFSQVLAVVPVPASAQRIRERGFNQAELLARYIARELKLPLLSHAVVKKLETPHQTGLSREERQQNLREAFAIADPSEVYGKSVLIIDDVFTTGFTAAALAEALLAAGAGPVYVATAARG